MAMPDVSFIRKEQTWVDKRGKIRQIPMKLICPGLGRTGTTSMQVALQELGFKPYHGWILFENPPDAILWEEAMKAKFEGKGSLYTRKDFDAILFDSDAILDIPGSLFPEELIDAYPEAKVVMTTRDIDSWYTSVLSTLAVFETPSLLLTLLLHTDRAFSLYMRTFIQCMNHQFSHNFAANGKAVYHSHLNLVRDKMLNNPNQPRAGDYLEFNVKQGWEPLCAFLAKDVPRDAEGRVKPFPRVNDRDTFTKTWGPYFDGLVRKMLLQGLAWCVPVAVAVVAGWWWSRRGRGG